MPTRSFHRSLTLAWLAALVTFGFVRPIFAQEVTQEVTLDHPLSLEAALNDVDDDGQAIVRSQTSTDDIAALPSTLRGAIADSLRLLFIEHSIRIGFQEKTRRELGGNFFVDYRKSIKMPTTWEDGDSWPVNYIGHPIHGAASGFIWLDHEDGAHDPELGFSWKYWSSRGRAAAWITAYSYQFEFGPLSEASIGNVGLRENTTGWVDHVVTPVGGLGILVAEDALDRFLIRRVESWTGNRFYRASMRMLFNPSRTLSNLAQGRHPWHRSVRPLTRR